MGWLDSREKRGPICSLQLHTFAEVVELPYSITLARQIVILSKDTNLTTDSLGGIAVVTSDDDNSNPSFFALCDGSSNFRAGRVEHANKAKKCQVLLNLGVLGCRFGRLQ